ncbi:MAG: response regulator, partial [Lachnospiraceae bacterium]|nr:response regulator [Lachnospiraceae bacterium]
IPIIAMTANAFREDAERCMEAGMNAHLAKPLDDEKIKQTIREELRKQNACHK